jgi:4'-phosphopantetheinyl transferase EntD
VGEGARVTSAFALELETLLERRLGAALCIAISDSGREALARALLAAARALDTVERWPCPYASLTHSGDVAIAVAVPPSLHAVGVGIDLEHDRPIKPEIARLICDDRERAWLAALPSERRAAETLRLWTAKEALFKADPVQGDAIVAEYALACPGDEVTIGGRLDSDHHAMVTSLRHAGAVVSVALCLSGGPS